MSIASPPRDPTPPGGMVRALPTDAGGPNAEPPRRAPAWLSYVLPVVAIAALLAVMVADAGTVRLDRPPPLRVELPGLAVDDIAMTWDAHEVEGGRIVGITDSPDGPVAVALLDAGSPVVLDVATGRLTRLDDAGAAPVYQSTLVMRSGRTTHIIGVSDGGADLWRTAAGPENLEVSERVSQRGLADLEEPIAAATTSRLQLILGTDAAGATRAWLRAGAGQWEPRPVTGLGEAQIDVIGVTGDAFLAGGSECSTTGCVPAIWRSTDGTTWSQVTALSREEGVVTGIASSGGAVYAVGTSAIGVGLSWRSVDGGRTWEGETTEGWRAALSVTVTDIDTESLPRTVRLAVNGETGIVREGGVLVTPLGDITVEELEGDALLRAGDTTQSVGVGASWSVQGVVEVDDLDIRDGRLVAVGTRRARGGLPAPTVWVRDEGTNVWNASALPGSVAPAHVAIGAERVLVAGSGERDAAAWLGTIALPDAELEATSALDRLLDGLSSDDPSLAADVLAPGPDKSSVLSLPGLGGLDLDPWHPSGAVDIDRLEAMAGFVSGLDTTVTTSGCDASAAFGDLTAMRVECDHTTTSMLLDLLGIRETKGTLTASTRDGLITSLRVDGPDAGDAIRELDAFLAAYAAQLEHGDAAVATERPPDADTAAALLEAAAAMANFAFSPGETRVVDGPLGAMEMSWIVEPFGPTAGSVTSLDWTGASYAAVTTDWVEETTALWSSPDGTVWDPIRPPEPSARIESLSALPGGRLVAWGEARAAFRMWLREGDDWRELALPLSAAADMWVRATAVNDAGALFVVGRWNRARGTNGVSGVHIGSDGVVRAVDLPPDAGRGQVALAANPSGFLLATRGESGARVWGSSSGVEWSLLSDRPIDLSGWIIDLAWHRGRYLALTEGDWDEACTAAPAVCTPPRDVWTSTDGTAWEKLSTTPDAGSAVMSELAVTDLGLISPVRYGRAFLLLWMSGDGGEWAVPAGILPRVERTERWEAGIAAAPSGFVLSTTQQNWQEQPSVSLITARFVDG